MDDEPTSGSLPTAALQLRSLTNLAPVAFVATIAVILDLVRWSDGTAGGIPPVVLPLLLAVITGGAIHEITRRRWRAWRWQILDRPDGSAMLVVERGLWTRTWQAVPFDRIQFVEVASGPLQRAFGLANLAVRTAGVLTPAVPLDDLDAGVAESLRRRLAPGSSS